MPQHSLASSPAFAPPPSALCSDAPRSGSTSPCREKNVAFYYDLHDNLYRPRHTNCCRYLRLFFQAAWYEFEDDDSRAFIRDVTSGESDSLYERAAKAVKGFEHWTGSQCHWSKTGFPNGKCCDACTAPDPLKLAKYRDERATNGCGFHGDRWCQPPMKHEVTVDGPANDASVSATPASGLAAAQAKVSQVSLLFADGAFNHRPYSNSAMGYHVGRTNGPYFKMAGHGGTDGGQLSWLDMAQCCAATPKTSSDAAVDKPDAAAVALPPASHCGAAAKGEGSCRAENPAFYKVADGSYAERHTACCAYMNAFIANAAAEFPDRVSQDVIAGLKGKTVFVQSTKLAMEYRAWNKDTCGPSTGHRCCDECIRQHRHKQGKFAPPSNGANPLAMVPATCLPSAEGWCGTQQVQAMPQSHIHALLLGTNLATDPPADPEDNHVADLVAVHVVPLGALVTKVDGTTALKKSETISVPVIHPATPVAAVTPVPAVAPVANSATPAASSVYAAESQQLSAQSAAAESARFMKAKAKATTAATAKATMAAATAATAKAAAAANAAAQATAKAATVTKTATAATAATASLLSSGSGSHKAALSQPAADAADPWDNTPPGAAASKPAAESARFMKVKAKAKAKSKITTAATAKVTTAAKAAAQATTKAVTAAKTATAATAATVSLLSSGGSGSHKAALPPQAADAADPWDNTPPGATAGKLAAESARFMKVKAKAKVTTAATAKVTTAAATAATAKAAAAANAAAQATAKAATVAKTATAATAATASLLSSGGGSHKAALSQPPAHALAALDAIDPW